MPHQDDRYFGLPGADHGFEDVRQRRVGVPQWKRAAGKIVILRVDDDKGLFEVFMNVSVLLIRRFPPAMSKP